MESDFDAKYSVNRRGSGSYKWDGMLDKFGDADLIPLWVADMDFKVPPEVINSLKEYLDFGVLGYAIPPQSYYDAVIEWEREKHGYAIRKEWMRYTPGVVPGIFWTLNALTEPGEACLVLTPCYYPFLDAVKLNNRKLITLDLVPDDASRYHLDMEAFERCITGNSVKMFLLCSPHNPVSKVWSREELREMMEICKRHGVYVISDEIHQDLVMSGHKHIPAATVGDYDDFLITITAPSKTFNLAGLQNAFAIIPDKGLKDRVEAHIKTIRVNKGTSLGYVAAEAAYRYGDSWLEGVKGVIEGNFIYMRDTLKEALPGVRVTPLEGTYLMWIDLGAYLGPEQLEHVVQHEARMAVDFGKWFWPDNEADTHIRVNLATSRANIEAAAANLIKCIKEQKE